MNKLQAMVLAGAMLVSGGAFASDSLAVAQGGASAGNPGVIGAAAGVGPTGVVQGTGGMGSGKGPGFANQNQPTIPPGIVGGNIGFVMATGGFIATIVNSTHTVTGNFHGDN